MATLVYSDVDGVDRSFALGAEPVTVGRGSECAIRSDDPRVSRVHARFFVDQGALWVEDLGSSNGIFVGPNKVARAPVPTGEIILVGSLLIRLVPSSGTLPPPVGLHGTLASWLDMERKARATVEEERDAFARRVGEMHQQLSAVMSARTMDPDAPDAVVAARQRDEAEARAAQLERAVAGLQDDLADARDRLAMAQADVVGWSSGDDGATATMKSTAEVVRMQAALEEAERARSIAEHAHGEAMREAQVARDELVALKKASAGEHEALRVEVARARESRMMAETAAGVTAAEKLAEADLAIAQLQRELAELRGARSRPQTGPDPKVQELTDRIAGLIARAEKAEKEAASAQIRAQGAERNLAGANATAARSEARAAEAEHKLGDADERIRTAEAELARTRERIAALDGRGTPTGSAAEGRRGSIETRTGAAGAPEGALQAAEARAAGLAAELAELTSQFETRRDRIVELEAAVAAQAAALAAAQAVATDAEGRTAAQAQAAAEQAARLAEADQRIAALQRKLDELAQADAAVAGAARTRDEASARAATAEETAREAERRSEDAEKRASAADTMAKAMAKDVAEALRRAADADTKARGVSRDLADALRRAEQAEARTSAGATAMREAEARATTAEARIATLEKELAATLDRAQRELDGKVAQAQKDSAARLDQAARELAAERSTALQLVDRRTQLERELAELRGQLTGQQQRAEAAERALREAVARAEALDDQLEALQDRIDDLESGIAVAETAGQASLEEARAALRTEQAAAAEARARADQAQGELAALRARIAELEGTLRDSDDAGVTAASALRDARQRIADLERAAEARAGAADDERERLADALSRADDAERKIDALSARAEAADLAIGRAGALQRQLDEALTRLAWLEREQVGRGGGVRPPSEPADTASAERIAAAEARARDAEGRARDSEARLAEQRAGDAEARRAADERARAAEARVADAEARLADAERRAEQARALGDELAAQAAELAELRQRAARADDATRASSEAERRIASSEQRVAAAEQRAQLAEQRAADAEQHAQTTEAGAQTLSHQLTEHQARIAHLEREVANADNVRSFAAETEREIAALQRDLRDARAKLSQVTLERDRLASELGDGRGDQDADATNPRNALKPSFDPEATALLNVAKYESLIVKTSELEQKVQQLERDDDGLRRQLAEAQERLRMAQIDLADDDGDLTRTGNQLPIAELADHVNTLEESIDSLRANMRAASDETAMMDPSESVSTISSAVSQAAEHVERARAAIRALAASIGMS